MKGEKRIFSEGEMRVYLETIPGYVGQEAQEADGEQGNSPRGRSQMEEPVRERNGGKVFTCVDDEDANLN